MTTHCISNFPGIAYDCLFMSIECPPCNVRPISQVTAHCNPINSVTRSGIFFYQLQLDGLGHPPCFKNLQHLEQEGVVPPNLIKYGFNSNLFHSGCDSSKCIIIIMLLNLCIIYCGKAYKI